MDFGGDSAAAFIAADLDSFQHLQVKSEGSGNPESDTGFERYSHLAGSHGP